MRRQRYGSRDRQWSRGVGRSYDRDRERDRDRDWDKDRDRDRDMYNERDWNRDGDKDRERERNRGRNRDNDSDNDRNRERDRYREMNSGRARGRDWERCRDRDWGRERDADKGRDWGRRVSNRRNDSRDRESAVDRQRRYAHNDDWRSGASRRESPYRAAVNGDRKGQYEALRSDPGQDDADTGSQKSRLCGVLDGCWVEDKSGDFKKDTVPVQTDFSETESKRVLAENQAVPSPQSRNTPGRMVANRQESGGKVADTCFKGLSIGSTTADEVNSRRPRWDKAAPGHPSRSSDGSGLEAKKSTPTTSGPLPLPTSAAARVSSSVVGKAAKGKLFAQKEGSTLNTKKRSLWGGGGKSSTSTAEQTDEAALKWQAAAAALGPSQRQSKFLRLLGAKDATAATVEGTLQQQGSEETAGGGDEMPNEGGENVHSKVLTDLEIQYQKAHRAHYWGRSRGLGT